MEARNFEPERMNLYSFDDIRKELTKLASDEYTFERFQSFMNWSLENETLIKEMIGKKTIAELKKIVVVYSDEKKSRIVSKIYDSVIGYFNISDGMVSYSPFDGETYAGNLRKKLDKLTIEDYEKWRADKQAAKLALRKSLENPETLEEFRTFIRNRGEGALTSEQRAVYDGLVADTLKERREQEDASKAVVKQVDVGDTKMELKNSFHAKKQIPLWVVQLTDRVERDTYQELNNRAKKLGGYYSSYRGQGAIPGFVFEDENSATLFMQVKEGDVNISEVKAEVEEAKVQTRAQAMRERGEKYVAEGEEELSRDRKANTARRARFASSAEAKAEGLIRFGKTLISIAEGLEADTIKYLENLTAGTELDQLQGLLSSARQPMSRTLNIRYDEVDHNDARLVDYVRYPYPGLYKENAKATVEKQLTVSGKKLAAARILKKIARTKEDMVYFTDKYSIEDFATVLCESRGLESYEFDRYKSELLDYRRVHDRLKLQTIHELRAALRELLQLRSGAKISDEQKRMLQIRDLERTFVGKKIEGFFPTPKELAEKIVALAGIEDGDSILEPSAGLGHIADVISEMHPDNELICVEDYHPLFEALQLKGYNALHKDFLLDEPTQTFDKVLMNPPFEGQMDIFHVLHAFKYLKPGGRLVAITSTSWTFRDNAESINFREFVEQHGYYEKNPEGSFASAFRPTGVATCTVVLEK